MKKTGKWITMALTLCMVVGLFAVTAFAATPKKIYYLGDSVTTAYSTDAYIEHAGYPVLVDDTEIMEVGYPFLTAKGLGIGDLSSNAHCGWRVRDTLTAIEGKEPEPYMQTYLSVSDWFAFKGEAKVDFAAEGRAIRNEIGDADYISLNFGANDIFAYGLLTLANTVASNLDLNSISLPDFTAIKSTDDAVNAIKSLIGVAKDAVGLINELERLVEEGLESFKTAYPLLLDYITENRKDGAKVFVNSVVFPLQLKADVTDAFTLRLFTKGDKVAAEANCFLKKLCDKYESVYYVDTTKTENYDVVESLSKIGSIDVPEGVFGNLNLPEIAIGDINLPDTAFRIIAGLLRCAHPNEAGHEYMANQIIDAIRRADTKPENVRVSYNALGQVKISWDKISGAASYIVYRASEKSGKYSVIGATPAQSWVDMFAPADGTFYYKVVASMDALGQRRTEESDAITFSTREQSFVGRTITEILNAAVAAVMRYITMPLTITRVAAKIVGIL